MKIIISSITLDRSGVPTYTLTLYNELISRGYDVTVYSPNLGALAGQMKTIDNLKNVDTPDIILAQHKTCAVKLKNAFSDVPMILLTHGIEPEEEQVPRINIDWYIPINEQNKESVVSQQADPTKITIIRDFVNTDIFRPLMPLLKDNPKVLFISNYKKWRAYQDIKNACKQLGLDFQAVGAPYGRSRNMAKTINEFDLVITWGLGILEAMACGRPVISYDKRMGAGYITPEVYMDSRTYNFGGVRSKYIFDLEGLINEIKKYNPEDGIQNRELILTHHDSKKCVDQIINIINSFLKL